MATEPVEFEDAVDVDLVGEAGFLCIQERPAEGALLRVFPTEISRTFPLKNSRSFPRL